MTTEQEHVASAPSVVAPRTYTVAETCVLLGIGLTLGRELIRNGQIPSIKLGRRYVIPAVALEEFLARPQAS